MEKTIYRLLLWVALIFRGLNTPHILKYILFRYFLKGRNIVTKSKISISNIYLNLNISDFIEYWIFMDGLYEKDWVYQVRKYIDGKNFIDIGANVGGYSLALFKDAKHIYAFEPANDSFKSFTKNIRFNSIKNITLIKKAVSSKNLQKVKLFKNTEDKGQNSLVINNFDKYELVETITLDKFIELKKIRNIGLVKIDVEGLELEVIKGAKKTITKKKIAFLVEFNKTLQNIAGGNLEEIYNIFRKKGYHGYRLKNKRLLKFGHKNLASIRNENILFLNSPHQHSNP